MDKNLSKIYLGGASRDSVGLTLGRNRSTLNQNIYPTMSRADPENRTWAPLVRGQSVYH